MTGIEVLLIIIGVIFMLGSFFVTEKLSGSELNKIAELSQDEIKLILDKELKRTSDKINDQIDTAIDDSIDKVDRALDKETNEKIMAISEYSDTVLENMNKTHNEIMFLYSMLNDKHTELTELSGQLSKTASEVEKEIEQAAKIADIVPDTEMEDTEITAQSKHRELEPVTIPENSENHNDMILALHKQGKDYIEIARELGLGLGEVRLVVDLYRGEETSEA